MSNTGQHIRKAIISAILAIAIVIGVLIGAVYLADAALPLYQQKLVNILQQRIGQPARVDDLDISWNWRGPFLQLDGVAILNQKTGTAAMRADRIRLRFAFTDFLHGKWFPDGISIKQPELAVYRDANGDIHIRGVDKNTTFDWQHAGRMLQKIQVIHISGGALHWLGGPRLEQNLQITELAIAMHNNGNQHRLQISATLGPAYGGKLQLDVAASGQLDQLAQLQAHGALQVKQLSVAKLLQHADLTSLQLDGGQGAVHIKGQWRNGSLQTAHVSVHANNMQWGKGEVSHTLPTGFDATFAIQAQQQGYRLTLEQLDNSDAAGTVHANLAAGKYSGSFHNLPVQLLLAWATVVAPDKLAGWQAQGRLTQLQFNYADSESGQYQVKAGFKDLRLASADEEIVVTGLGGQVSLSANGGTLQINTQEGGNLTWQPWLRGTLVFSALGAHINWSQDSGDWLVKVPKLHWQGAGLRFTGSAGLRIPPSGSPVADLQLQVASGNLATLVSHVSLSPEIGLKHLRHWLAQAIRGGQVSAGEIVLHGPLERFPFAGGGGKFRIQAQFADVRLAYMPGWPDLMHVNGTLVLDGLALNINTSSASMLGVKLEPATAQIKDLSAAVLKVSGGTQTTEISKLIAFLPASPLADKFGALARTLTVSGPANLDLELTIPLLSGPEKIAVNGLIHLHGILLKQPALPYSIRNIHGQLRFDRHGLYAHDLHGNMAGLRLVAGLQPGKHGSIQISVTAPLVLPRNALLLKAFVPTPVVARASGKTTLHMQLSVAGKGQISNLVLHSKLQGLALDLPAPLGKTAAASVPLRITVSGDRSRVDVDYGDRLDLKLHLSNGRLRAANFMFGGGVAKPANVPGLRVSGAVAQANVAAWSQFLADFDKQGSGPKLKSVHLQIDQLQFGRLQLAPISVQVSPPTDGQRWQLTFSGKGAAGTLVWQHTASGPARVSAQLAHLNVSTTDAPATDGQDPTLAMPEQPLDPADFPALSLHSQTVHINGADFGSWDIVVDAVANGLELQQLRIAGGVVDGQASGRWVRSSGKTQAELTLQLQGSGIEHLLEAAGLDAKLRVHSTRVSAHLKIAPNPDGLTAATLNGTLSLHMQNGQLLSVEPGAGRLLGLLNIYALPRRFLLDFGDVVDKGMAFDSIDGDFVIKQGTAHTDNLNIQTPSITISIRGNIGLDTKTYNEHVTVIPQLSTSIAVASTILGGPAIGAAVFLAQKLLNEPIQKLSALHYHLVGSWANPEIKDIKAEE